MEEPETREVEVQDCVLDLADVMAKGARERAAEMGIDTGEASNNNIYYFRFGDGTVNMFWLTAAEAAAKAIQSGEIQIPPEED